MLELFDEFMIDNCSVRELEPKSRATKTRASFGQFVPTPGPHRPPGVTIENRTYRRFYAEYLYDGKVYQKTIWIDSRYSDNETLKVLKSELQSFRVLIKNGQGEDFRKVL